MSASTATLESDWRLERFQLEPTGPAHSPGETAFTMSLAGKDSAHGQVACNVWRGHYRVEADTLRLEVIGTTRRRCLFEGPSPAETLYSFYLEALERGGVFDVGPATLTLRFADDTRWRFSRVVP